jgi:hypothetical protein
MLNGFKSLFESRSITMIENPDNVLKLKDDMNTLFYEVKNAEFFILCETQYKTLFTDTVEKYRLSLETLQKQYDNLKKKSMNNKKRLLRKKNNLIPINKKSITINNNSMSNKKRSFRKKNDSII